MPTSPTPLPSGFVTFMFTDIVGSTEMGEKMSGTTTDERQRAYADKIRTPQANIVSDRVAAQNGRVVKTIGDGFLVVFDDAEKAVLCALEIQHRIAVARIDTPVGVLRLRIGFHTGYAASENGDYIATAVNKAARVQSAAEPGGVFLSKETNAAVETKIRGVTTRSAGSFDLKGIGKEELFSAHAADVPPPPTVLKTSIPHNLPTLQPFFGREEELKKIADALDPDSRTWGALIDGPGGMGKTSLAVRAAYDAPPDVFKKIIFVSLKTRELDDDGVRDLSGFILSGLVELLNELARELGCDDIAKAPEEHRPRLLLDKLRGTQTLLVLDNLESLIKKERDTLFTFVKKLPAGCKAILTSRGRIGSGAEELILEALSQEAALATLAELATHNPLLEQTSEAERLVLYRETAGKPLLLRWTAGQLGRGHCLTFTDALHFIRSCPEGNDPLEFIFGDLVGDFDEAETKVLCALTYFTLPAKVEHVAAIAGLPEPDTDRALRKLTVRSLAVPTNELKTFTLVPMVPDFLRKKKPEVVAETGDRLEKRAYALIMENGYKRNAPFHVLNAAWPIIAAAIPLFLSGSNDRLQEACNALRFFFEFTGRWDEWQSFEEQAEKIALRCNDFYSGGWRAFQGGWVHYLRHQVDEVVVAAIRTISYWRKKSDIGAWELGCAFLLLGHAHRLQKDLAATVAAYQDSIALFQSGNKEIDRATALNWLATAEYDFGKLEDAEEHLREALNVASRAGHSEGVASYTGNLADLALKRNDWLGAETRAREALPLSEKVDRQELVALDNHRLAHALVRQGKAPEALPHARRAVEIFTRLGHPDLPFAQATLAECEQAAPPAA